jgi:hypothetical protein
MPSIGHQWQPRACSRQVVALQLRRLRCHGYNAAASAPATAARAFTHKEI